MSFSDLVEHVGRGVDAAGVLVMVLGIVVSAALFLRALVRRGEATHGSYTDFRQGIGRAILLGLEVLVAADIIRTVAVTPTFRTLGVLGGIVLIRTFLSATLELELTGRWPWQKSRGGTGAPPVAAE